jgi:formamidase
MPETVFRVDQSRSMRDQDVPGHNRWHPDIPAAASVRPGDVFRIECKDWTDGQVRNDDSANDIRDMVLDHNHMLSGPIHVEGAEPGDLLVVDYLDLGPARAGAASVGDEPGEGWGYTGIFDINNGGGFLTDHFPRAGKVIWDFQGMYATSRHLPGVRIASNVHAGLAGCAPDADLLARWNRREQALIDTNPDRVPPLALPPLPNHALLGTMSSSDAERAAQEAARTVPPREHGGNVDIKNLSIGSRVFYPVYVPGAKFSIGDLHFAQGDWATDHGARDRGEVGYVDQGHLEEEPAVDLPVVVDRMTCGRRSRGVRLAEALLELRIGDLAGEQFERDEPVLLAGVRGTVDLAHAAPAELRLEREPVGVLVLLPLQQIVYRQLMYAVLIRSTVSA